MPITPQTPASSKSLNNLLHFIHYVSSEYILMEPLKGHKLLYFDIFIFFI